MLFFLIKLIVDSKFPIDLVAFNVNFIVISASDGQQIYLHAVNVQMLEMTYGCLRDSPSELTGVIVEKEAGSMTVELRKRLRYLQHLPVTAQFEVAEIELLPPLVTQSTIDAFKGNCRII